MNEFEHGQRVCYTQKYVRLTERKLHESGRFTEVHKTWKPVPEGGTGIFLGMRTLSNGTRDWESDEVGYIFNPKEHFKVALISPSPDRNPIYVPLEDVKETK